MYFDSLTRKKKLRLFFKGKSQHHKNKFTFRRICNRVTKEVLQKTLVSWCASIFSYIYSLELHKKKKYIKAYSQKFEKL